MGCITSKKEMDDVYPNIFQVINVDEHGNHINPGQLEITDVDLILYQHGKPPIKWPLKTLRRYGFDSEHFSFESGRRCQTGPGIYAFRCRRAEQLFNLLQSRIQIRNNLEAGDGVENSGVIRDSSYLEPISVRRTNPGHRFSTQNGTSRLSPCATADGSLGPLSPQSLSSNSFPLDNNIIINPLSNSRPSSQNVYANEEVIASVIQDVEETNNNKTVEERISPSMSHIYTNSSVLETLSQAHSLGDDCFSPKEVVAPIEGNHLYMNVTPGTDVIVSRMMSSPSGAASTNSATAFGWEPEGPVHNYANFEAECGLESKKGSPQTPTETRKLNYIILDLEPCSEPPKSGGHGSPDSPRKPTAGYAAIDFKKTVALSHSVNPNFDNDSEGSRKTRHNSNIANSAVNTRHSSSGLGIERKTFHEVLYQMVKNLKQSMKNHRSPPDLLSNTPRYR